MAHRVRDPQLEQFWRDVLSRFQVSGLSVRAFCRQEQLREPRFYAWRRTLAERDGLTENPSHNEPVAVQWPDGTSARKPPAFLPVVMRAESAGAGIVLELGSGRLLRWPESLPIERLAAFVRALEEEVPS